MERNEASCSERDRKIDTLRSFCNLMIVVWHAWAVYRFCPKIPFEFYFWKGLCGLMTVTMPAFFFLSGYLLMHNLNRITVMQKIARRVKRLFVPYVIWNLIFVVFLLMLHGTHGFVKDFFGSRTFSWQSIRPLVFDLSAFPADTPLWFLRALLIYSLVGMPFLLVMKRKYGPLLVFTCLFVYLGFAEFSGLERGFEYSYPAYSMLAFLFGALFMTKGISPFTFFSRWYFVVCGFAGICGMALYTIVFRDACWLKNLAFVLELPLMFIIVQRFGEWFMRSLFFDRVNNASFFIYCSHWLICPLLVSLVYPIFVDMLGSLSMFILVFIVAGIPVIVYLHDIMVRILPRLIKVLNGRL